MTNDGIFYTGTIIPDEAIPTLLGSFRKIVPFEGDKWSHLAIRPYTGSYVRPGSENNGILILHVGSCQRTQVQKGALLASGRV